LGKFIVTSTLMGHNLYKGNHLPTQGFYPLSTDSLLPPDLRAELRDASEVRRDSVLQGEAIKTILGNKKEVALMALKKVPRLWLNIGYGTEPSKRSLAIAGFHMGLICLGFYGCFRAPGDLRYLGFVPLTTVVFSSLMYLAVASVVRFVFPLIPLLLPYAAAGFLGLTGRARG
jgi:hypothetical protein